MFILKPQMPLGEDIHSCLRSSHLKPGEQSPYSFFRPSESKCCLLLHPRDSQMPPHLSNMGGPPKPHGPTLPEMKGLPSTSPLPCFPSVPTPLPAPVKRHLWEPFSRVHRQVTWLPTVCLPHVLSLSLRRWTWFYSSLYLLVQGILNKQLGTSLIKGRKTLGKEAILKDSSLPHAQDCPLCKDQDCPLCKENRMSPTF